MKHIATAIAILMATSSCTSMRVGQDRASQSSEESWGNGESGVSGTPLPGRNESYSFFGPGSERVLKNEFSPVYFEFDRFDIKRSEATKLQQVANYLGGGKASLLIAGFTDNIGTEEYNRVLGERRALAVREVLISMGTAPAILQTVSFGEDMPAGGDAAGNRRAEFGVVK